MQESHDVVIVGGGIAGLATALALHRKGIGSLVLERSDTLRASGAAIGMWANAWRALDQLQVGDELREKAVLLKELCHRTYKSSETGVAPVSDEFRCLVRKDLVEALASKLPPETIRFGCHVDEITTDPATSFPIIHASDGSTIKAKVLIGCDGSNSMVAKFLELKDPTPFGMWVIRGFTTYPGGHTYGNNFLRYRCQKSFFGRVPITDTLVHFFFRIPMATPDPHMKNDPEQIRKLAIEMAQEYTPDIIEMAERCDLDSLNFTQIRHRIPCHLDKGKCQKGTVTVAGDAMHVLSPFLGQGGALGMEDAVVLARQLASAFPNGFHGEKLVEKIGAAQREYVKERWPRLMRVSTMSYLGVKANISPQLFMKMFYLLVIVSFFGGLDDMSHTQYDCGKL